MNISIVKKSVDIDRNVFMETLSYAISAMRSQVREFENDLKNGVVNYPDVVKLRISHLEMTIKSAHRLYESLEDE